eukprot:TRINITY_DN65110_c0_g1_i1.p1 TRINITY_DN65110_c0_g1~~TRINITY_DN65110_c0_g1_i1.p1  ORF type:complete len:520 (+),score=28.41 TRINITY_DN65110_c0_g1_i1:103-1662(+)
MSNPKPKPKPVGKPSLLGLGLAMPTNNAAGGGGGGIKFLGAFDGKKAPPGSGGDIGQQGTMMSAGGTGEIRFDPQSKQIVLQNTDSDKIVLQKQKSKPSKYGPGGYSGGGSSPAIHTVSPGGEPVISSIPHSSGHHHHSSEHKSSSSSRPSSSSGSSHHHSSEHKSSRNGDNKVSRTIHFRHLQSPDDPNSIQLGQGSQAVVKRVKHLPTGNYYALKIITVGNDEARQKAIYQELERVLAHKESECPYLCASYEARHSRGKVYILMEYMRCGALHDICKNAGPMQEIHAATIACHALIGLEHLHKRGLIHRDIKPSNMLVDGEGHVKIADFGLATFTDTFMQAHSAVGTQQYFSPERITEGSYSYQSDIWSFGVSIAYCLLGRYPWRYKTVVDLMAKIQTTVDLSFLNELNGSPECTAFLKTCLAHSPNDRPSATQLLQHPWIKKHIPNTKQPPTLQPLLARINMPRSPGGANTPGAGGHISTCSNLSAPPTPFGSTLPSPNSTTFDGEDEPSNPHSKH